jgi:Uma2 family endonuclease
MAVHVDAALPIHALTVSDLDRMIEAGVLTEDDRVELLEGVLVEMSPEGPPHAAVIARLTRHFVLAVEGQGLGVRVQHPLRAEARSQPEPDLAVTANAFSWTGHPTSAVLVVEVAQTSLAIDRGRKAGIYARAGVSEYWIVDVAAMRIEVYCEPGPDGYAVMVSHGAGASLTPAGFACPPVEVDELLASG